MKCIVCKQLAAEVGLLCEDCHEQLASPIRIAPEQVISKNEGRSGTRAAFVDVWGRSHLIEARTLIGRNVDGGGLSILEASISRHHAHVQYESPGKSWTLRDLGSANGTTVNDQPVKDSVVLKDGDRIGVGQVGFYFVADAERIPSVPQDPMMSATIKPGEAIRFNELFPGGARAGSRSEAPVAPLPPMDTRPVVMRISDEADDLDEGENEAEDREVTDVGMPHLKIALVEPTGGGGGVVMAGANKVQLTTTQFELVALLVKRMLDESHQSSLVRGFVRSSELIAALSWDTHDPSENHVKQLVRRVRRSLIKAEIGDLIESRHRFGYRLRVIPVSRS